MSDARLERIEAKLDGLISDVSRLKIDLTGFKVDVPALNVDIGGPALRELTGIPAARKNLAEMWRHWGRRLQAEHNETEAALAFSQAAALDAKNEGVSQ